MIIMLFYIFIVLCHKLEIVLILKLVFFCRIKWINFQKVCKYKAFLCLFIERFATAANWNLFLNNACSVTLWLNFGFLLPLLTVLLIKLWFYPIYSATEKLCGFWRRQIMLKISSVISKSKIMFVYLLFVYVYKFHIV